MGGRQSGNVEDRRGMGGGTLIAGGGIGSIVLVLLALFFGFDPSALLQGDSPSLSTEAPSSNAPASDPEKEFVSVVLADTEDTWHELFARMGRQYREPKLVLFTGSVESACGMAGAAVGPFYCPSDQKLYLDLSFFRALRERFHAPGDFAQAYVIAHEVGHHVQTLLGITEQVAPARQRGGSQANQTSVRVELQADCLAGIWAHHAKQARDILEEGDVEEALNAASAIGDDRLQRQAQGRVAPETFTHGSSKQRVGWFARGFESGDLRQCDTFRTREL
jgi:predicted metalloprotease